LNRVASAKHAAVLKEAINLPLLGTVARDNALDLPSRHLGLVQASETAELEEFIERAADRIDAAVDLDRLGALATTPQALSVANICLPPLGQRIAVARDEAFAFAYPHMLQGWRNQGAEISKFSPLAGEGISADADAVFLPGGYPELYAGKLSANGRFLADLRGAARRGALIYGECGGYMVLGESLTDAGGRSHAMAGLLPVETSFAERKLSLGYRALEPLSGSPWSGSLRGHEFHYSTIVAEGTGDRLFAARDARGNDLGKVGLRAGRVMGSYAHVIA
jgi:cobyrinic acid a,c-diamide synthase